MNAALFLVVFLIAGVFFEWRERDADPAAMVGHGFTWVDWMFLIAISSIGGPTLAILFARVIYWLQRRSEAADKVYLAQWSNEAARSVRVAQGIDPPCPKDLAKMQVTNAMGPWKEGMPKEVDLMMKGRDGAPVHYTRTDIAERIEHRCYSSAAHYWVGAGEVPHDLFRTAELACGGWHRRPSGSTFTCPILKRRRSSF